MALEFKASLGSGVNYFVSGVSPTGDVILTKDANKAVSLPLYSSELPKYFEAMRDCGGEVEFYAMSDRLERTPTFYDFSRSLGTSRTRKIISMASYLYDYYVVEAQQDTFSSFKGYLGFSGDLKRGCVFRFKTYNGQCLLAGRLRNARWGFAEPESMRGVLDSVRYSSGWGFATDIIDSLDAKDGRASVGKCISIPQALTFGYPDNECNQVMDFIPFFLKD